MPTDFSEKTVKFLILSFGILLLVPTKLFCFGLVMNSWFSYGAE